MPESSWARRIRRAEHLRAAGGPAASLLEFYARLLRAQERLYHALHDRSPSGFLERDVGLMDDAASSLVAVVAEHGPEPLVDEARGLLNRGRSGVNDSAR